MQEHAVLKKAFDPLLDAALATTASVAVATNAVE